MRDHHPLPEPPGPRPGGADAAADTDAGTARVWWADAAADDDPSDAAAGKRRRRRWLLLAAFVETLLIVIGLAWLVAGHRPAASGSGRTSFACVADRQVPDDGHCDRAARDAAIRAHLSADQRAAAQDRVRDIVGVVHGLHPCPGSTAPCVAGGPGAVPRGSGAPLPSGPGAMPGGPGAMPGGGAPPPFAPAPDQVGAALVAAGFPDTVVRPARLTDPAPVGSLLFAVGIGPACVLGYDMPGGGSQWVVGRLPDDHCLTR